MNKKNIIILIILLILSLLFIAILTNNEIIFKNNQKMKKEAEQPESTEMIYMVNSTDEEFMNISIVINSNLPIKEILTPDNNAIKIADIKNKFALDYKVEKNKNYTFKVKLEGDDDYRDCLLDADTNKRPKIIQSNSYTYPLLTLTGVKLNKNVTIDYGEGTKNYYSLDNGNTWLMYEGNISISKVSTILAKTIIDGEITKIDKADIGFELASDAMPLVTYDGNTGTYPPVPSSRTGIRIDIDDGLVGKNIKVWAIGTRGSYYSSGSGSFYDVDGNVVKDWFGIWGRNGVGRYYYLIIPENAKQFRFRAENDFGYYATIGEISISE